jgi:hypothetical protein
MGDEKRTTNEIEDGESLALRQDIVIPISDEIAAVLQMARDDAAQLGLAVAPCLPRLLANRP